MDKLLQNLSQFFTRLEKLSFNQKISVGTILLAMVFASTFFYNQAQDEYDVLYSNLSISDAAAMTAKLKEAKAPFKLSDGGTTILVPRPRRNELVLETANELSSEQTISLSQIPPVLQGDVQKEWIKKLNTDSISEVLRSIRGIKNAQVIVSQPERSVFMDNQDPTTASVMLMVEPGFRLREEQIKVVKNLVAHSVPGLKVENVAIADNSGNPLEGPGGAGAGGVLSDADLRRKEFEEDTSKKVLSILTPLVGKDNVVVSVSSVMNFDQAQSKIHRVIPAGGSIEQPIGITVSAQEQTEEYAGEKGKKPAGGIAGSDSNVGNPSETQTFQSTGDEKESSKNGDYKFVKKTLNYINSEEDKNVLYATGNIERMTVAVVLNKVLTAKETEEIKELVINASGIDVARGDSVDIKGFQFNQPGQPSQKVLEESSKSAQEQAFILQIASIAAIVLLGLGALFMFYKLFKAPAEGEMVEEVGDYTGYQYAQLPADEEEEDVRRLGGGVEPELVKKRNEMTAIVEEDPDEAARVLVGYIKGAI